MVQMLTVSLDHSPWLLLTQICLYMAVFPAHTVIPGPGWTHADSTSLITPCSVEKVYFEMNVLFFNYFIIFNSYSIPAAD